MRSWLKIKSASANYVEISERTLRDWLKEGGLRHARIRNTILIKTDWIDEFLENHEVGNPKRVDDIVDEVCKDL